MTSFVFDFEDDFINLGTTTAVGDRPYAREDFQRHHEIGRGYGDVRRAYECDLYTLLSRAVGLEEAKESIRRAGMKGDDAVGLRANATPKSGIMLTTHVPTGHRLKNRELWTRFAALCFAAFCVATAFLFHYKPDDIGELINGAKDLGLAGGFLFLAAGGPGGWALDRPRIRED